MKGLHKNSVQKVDNPHQWMIDDARMELIQQIKAKIEQLKKDVDNTPLATEQIAGYLFALVDVQKLLSTLQEQPVKTNIVEDLKHYLATTPKEQIEKDWDSLKEWGKVGPSVSEFLGWEQPVCEGLEEEIERYIPTSLAVKFPTTDIETIKSDIRYIARHFAQWQMGKDLSSINKSYESGVVFGMNAQKEQDDKELSEKIASAYQLGRKDEKEQMMENALHGWLDEDNEPPYDLNVLCEEKIPFGKFKHCDKVKIIIVKED